MAKRNWIFLLAAYIVFTGAVLSCTKINESTTLGGDLIPGVDNVNTFDTTLSVETNNELYDDSIKTIFGDVVAAGDINDPVFGNRQADFYFNLIPSIRGQYPFIHKDSVKLVDSIVLSLSYRGSYGDSNAQQTFRVFEIAQNNGFRADSLYKFKNAGFSDRGVELGSSTFTIRNLKDSVPLRNPGDTVDSKVANVVRIRFNNAATTNLWDRFRNMDTSTNPATGGFRNDSIFRTLFAGLAVKANTASDNALTYFSLNDINNTKLTVYYRVRLKSNPDSFGKFSYSFIHGINGQANTIMGAPGGTWASTIGGPVDDRVYIQSSPSGSYGSVFIKDLPSFPNRIIHRAELIVTPLPSAQDNILTPPNQLFLDRYKKGGPDTAFAFYRDINIGFDGSVDAVSFGGNRRSDGTYRFNITRHIQNVITRRERNDTLRLHLPLRTTIFTPTLVSPTSPLGQFISFQFSDRVAAGRVVVAGGNYPVDAQRMRLRIIYSKL